MYSKIKIRAIIVLPLLVAGIFAPSERVRAFDGGNNEEVFVIPLLANGQTIFATIQDAIDAVCDGGSIFVSPGEYKERLTITNKGVNFFVDSNAIKDRVIIDGCGMGSVLLASNDGMARSVMFSERFEFCNGSFGAIEIFNVDLTLEQVIISLNFSPFEGGGVFQIGGSLNCDGCTFKDNLAVGPGGNTFVLDGQQTFTNTIFSNSTSGDSGGSTAAVSSGSPGTQKSLVVIKDSSIASSIAMGNGGGASALDAELSFENVRISQSSAGNSGGAISISGPCELKSVNTRLFSNQTFNLRGGAISAQDAIIILIGNAIGGNVANDTGGGLLLEDSVATIVNSILSGNSSGGGGSAVESQNSTVDIINSNILKNGSAGGDSAVSAIASSNLHISNSIVFENEVAAILGEAGSHIQVDSSIVEGGYPGTNVLDVDPGFVDPIGDDNVPCSGDEDFGLSQNSPAIDSGNNGLFFRDICDIDNDGDTDEFFPVDLNGNDRFVAGTDNFNLTATIDIGAIEFQGSVPSVLLGDVNLDGVVDLLDVSQFIDRIAQGDFQAEADTNQDNAVNLLDVASFIEILSQ